MSGTSLLASSARQRTKVGGRDGDRPGRRDHVVREFQEQWNRTLPCGVVRDGLAAVATVAAVVSRDTEERGQASDEVRCGGCARPSVRRKAARRTSSKDSLAATGRPDGSSNLSRTCPSRMRRQSLFRP
ncbi:MAG: hypothetical protein K0S37_3836 [Microbacterium sp.]|nr:hypothetical protein [Microbacterium sp.]